MDIEKSLLLLHGDYFSDSGLFKVLEILKFVYICSLRTVNSLVNDIKGVRYALQLSACIIYKNPIHLWVVLLLILIGSIKLVMALYWEQIIELQIYILICIQSIRESNFQLHILTLYRLTKTYFALYNYNYSRWLTVHLFDLADLEKQHPDVYENF